MRRWVHQYITTRLCLFSSTKVVRIQTYLQEEPSIRDREEDVDVGSRLAAPAAD